MALENNYKLDHRGQINSIDYRIYFRDATGQPLSPWHDIRLRDDEETFKMVVEVPRWTTAWMAASMQEPLNPIRQDSTGGQLRYMPNLFPYHGSQANYGFLPQTWINPDVVDLQTNCRGCARPVRVFEIGERVAKIGGVINVKVLGIFAMLMDERIWWFALAIDAEDPIADLLNDIDDVKKYKPTLIKGIQDWFYRFKTSYMDKVMSKNIHYHFDGHPKDHSFAVNTIMDCHEAWSSTVANKINTCWELKNTTLKNPYTIDPVLANRFITTRPESSTVPALPMDTAAISKWYFGHLKEENGEEKMDS